jgi:hypothetical protein
MKYGGWGIRYNPVNGFRVGLSGIGTSSFNSKTTMYNVSGRYVLQLELKTEKKVLIGTQKTKELEAVIYQIKRKNKEY